MKCTLEVSGYLGYVAFFVCLFSFCLHLSMVATGATGEGALGVIVK